MEVVVPFFMGKLDVSDTYCDDIREIARNYVTSLTGFWFDFLTSLPWSFNDLYTLQVPIPTHDLCYKKNFSNVCNVCFLSLSLSFFLSLHY